MAFGMKRWVGALLLGSAMVAIWLLPPEPWLESARSRDPESAEEIREERLRASVQRHADLLAVRRRTDSLLAELRAARARGEGAVIGGVPDFVPEADARWVRGRLEEEAARLGSLAPGVQVGLFVVDGEYGRHPRITTRSPDPEYYITEEDGVTACLAAVTVRERYLTEDWWDRTNWNRELRVLGGDGPSHLLGPCAFHAAHGAPGPGVARWLREGGFVLAQVRGTPPPLEEGWRKRARFRRTTLFGSLEQIRTSLILDGCRSGRWDVCRALARDPSHFLRRYVRRSGIARVSWLQERSALAYRGRPISGILGRFRPDDRPYFFLADLEREAGEETFRRFWTSAEPFEEAFSGAFGETPERWLRRELVELYGPFRAGASTSPANILLSILVAGLMGGVAVALSLRREVR